MIAPLPWPFSLFSFSGWLPAAAGRTVTPAARAVESLASGVAPNPAPDATIHDVWTREPHGGSADLVEHPATHTELALAKCELDGDEGAYDALLAYTLTAERTSVVLAQARRIARADALLGRVEP